MKIPQRKKRGRPLKDSRMFMHIVATVDYRGIDDSQLFFLFRDPPRRLLEEVFNYLCGNGNGIAREAIVTDEHDVIRRIGKGYNRKAVEMVEPNFDFCGLEDMKILIESVMHRYHPCSFKWMPIDKFLNV